MLPFFKKYWPFVVLILTSFVLCVLNYTPGTILSGWDTLHPEFNWGLNFQRIFFGVFREEQGLGAVAGHSHMSELPRYVILWIADIFLGTDFLRYFYIFLTLIIGPIGMFIFLKRIIFKNKNTIASFLGAMFYLLNLGTMQQFVVPFEMFNTLYAALPFLMLFSTEYLLGKNNKPINKSLIYFCITTLLATPMSYAGTLWYVYFLLFAIYIAFFCLLSLMKRDFSIPKKALILLLVTIIINSFWLFPNLYFIKNHSMDVQASYINTLFSQQAFLYNKEFGNGNDLLLMKSFLFDWGVYTNFNSYDKLLKPWITHLNQLPNIILGYGFGIVTIIGLIYSTIKKKKAALAFLPVTIVTLFFLINENFPTSYLFKLLRDSIPLLREAMRFPHSKFYIHYIFVYTVFFALGQVVFLQLIKRFPKKISKVLNIIYPLIISSMLIYYMLPAFSGNLISEFVRIQFPPEYKQMSEWFNSQADTRRIAPLPINSFWGWDYYNWHGNDKPSFQGAGFLWFNIKQPLLVRDFDRWSVYNEGYYKEMSHAVYSNDVNLLKQVIAKYDIGYILLDTSNISPLSDPSVLFYDQIREMLKNRQLLGIEKVEKFGNFITVYQFKESNMHVYSLESPASVSPIARVKTQDKAYQKYTNYINTLKTDNPTSKSTIFPFRNIIDSESKLLIPYEVRPDGIHLKTPDYENKNFQHQSFLNSEDQIPASLFIIKNDNKLSLSIYPFTPNEKTPASPIKKEIELPDMDSKYIISINQINLASINSLDDDTPYGLGRVQLNTKSPNSIAVYKAESDTSYNPDFSNLEFSLRSCGKTNNNQLFGIDFLNSNDGFSLHGKNISLCMVTPFSELLPELTGQNLDEILLKIDFKYSNNHKDYSSVALPEICVSDLATGGCINYVSKANSSNFSFANSFSSYFGIKPDNYKNLGLKINLDASRSNKDIGVSYTDFTLGLSKPVYFNVFSQDELSNSLSQTANKIISPEMIIPFSNNAELSRDITTLPKTSGSCESNPLTQSENNQKQTIIARENYIRYSADEGTLCDSFSYQNLPQSQGYILLIDSRNINGLPLSVCATNYISKRCDIYGFLGKNSDFKTDAFIIPPISENGFGYDINISNFGIRNTPAINDLKSVQVIPLPYDWLTSIEIQLDSSEKTSGSDAQILKYHKINPLYYMVDINSQNQSTVLALSHSYDEGWKAYMLKEQKSNLPAGEAGIKDQIQRTFPSIFGEEITDHVMVNNWANGWVLDDQEPKTKNQEQTIAIVYLPQYLQYIGFSLVVLTFVGIFALPLFDKRRRV